MPSTQKVKLINLGQLSSDPIISINVPAPSTRPMSYYYMYSITMLSSKGILGQHSLQLKVGGQTGDSAGLKFYKATTGHHSINVRLLDTSSLVTYSGGWIYSGGHWDNSVRGYSLSEHRTVFHRLWHSGRVTCLACDAFGSKLITGSEDESCCIWSIEPNGTIKANPLQTLFGHSEAISGCAISTELDMAVSASSSRISTQFARESSFAHYKRPINPFSPFLQLHCHGMGISFSPLYQRTRFVYFNQDV